MEGWISLHRKFLDWEWFDDPNMVKLFLYLLLKARHSDGNWKGVELKRGEILTGLDSLSLNLKISKQSLRTCLKRLEKTQEINTQVTNKYRVITICKYDSYQDNQQATNKPSNTQLTSNQQATNKQPTANNNGNNENNDNNENKKEYSDEIRNFTGSLSKYFDKEIISKLDNKQAAKWNDCIRLMIDKDKRTKEEIEKVVEWGRNSNFWRKNFITILKLRKSNDEGVKFYDVFLNQMKDNKTTSHVKTVVTINKPVR